jgi:hypothetical protein
MARFGGADAAAGTAQELFQHLPRDLIGRPMRELGFSEGRYGFGIQRADCEASLTTQKNRHSTKHEVNFWVHLNAFHKPTQTSYWHRQLDWLIPDMREKSWTLTVDSPPEPVAESVLDGPAGRASDPLFSHLDDDDAYSRRIALEYISERAAGDPRTVPVVLDRLRHDPAPGVRERAALLLRPHAHVVQVREQLENAAD